MAVFEYCLSREDDAANVMMSPSHAAHQQRVDEGDEEEEEEEDEEEDEESVEDDDKEVVEDIDIQGGVLVLPPLSPSVPSCTYGADKL